MQLFIVLLLSRVTVAAVLAGCHGDRDKDHLPRQNCTAAGFSHVPPGLDPSTQVLLFPHNLFSNLAWSSFQLFPQIHEVDLTGNQLPQVPPSAPPVLPTLRVLHLGSNLISALPDGCFSACPALTELYLDNNTIRSLSDHTFSGLSSLEILDLSSNHIQLLPELLLHPLSSIETLYLEGNQIQVMPDDWFSQKEEVPYLYLSANPWACSCALAYLHGYLDEHEDSVYTRSGPNIINDWESVVCDSPPRLHKRALISLSAPELCPSTSPAPARPGTRTAVPAAGPTTDATASPLAPPPATASMAPTDTTFVASTTDQLPWSQTARLLVVITTHTEGERSGTRTSVPAAGPTTDPHGWPQAARQPEVADLQPPTSAPPLATTSITAAKTTTERVPSSQTATLRVVIATRAEGSARVTAADAGRFCVWLFAGCFLLCLLSAAIAMTTSARLLFLYCTTYKPLKASLRRHRAGPARLRLLTKPGGGAPGGGAPGGGAPGGGAVYRSVLFVHRDEQQKVGFYRRSLQRLLSREEELQGWRDVTEEWGVSASPGRRSYSVILRQEAGTGAEQLEWVLGAWEESTGSGARRGLDLGLLS